MQPTTYDSSNPTPKILLVEDEEPILDLMKEVLEIEGYAALTALNGESALKIVEREKDSIGLMLTDMGLPDMGGWDLLKKVRAIVPSIHIVCASGYFEPELRKNLILEGAEEFVQKPYDMDKLLTIIREKI